MQEHYATHSKTYQNGQNMACMQLRVREAIYAHGGHSWMRMGVGYYKWGLGHGNEARQATDGHFRSWEHARTTKKQSRSNQKSRFGEEGQGRLEQSRVLIIGLKGPI